MSRIYTIIEKLATQLTGLILDYQDLVDDFDRSMVLIFQYLWPDSNHQDTETKEIIKDIWRITDREKRSQASGFFSPERGPASGSGGVFHQVFERHKADLDQSYAAYQQLLRMRAKVSL